MKSDCTIESRDRFSSSLGPGVSLHFQVAICTRHLLTCAVVSAGFYLFFKVITAIRR